MECSYASGINESGRQVRINEAKETVAVLEALAASQPGLPQDLAVVNFGLHYKADQRLANDVAWFHAEWLAHKVTF